MCEERCSNCRDIILTVLQDFLIKLFLLQKNTVYSSSTYKTVDAFFERFIDQNVKCVWPQTSYNLHGLVLYT